MEVAPHCFSCCRGSIFYRLSSLSSTFASMRSPARKEHSYYFAPDDTNVFVRPTSLEGKRRQTFGSLG